MKAGSLQLWHVLNFSHNYYYEHFIILYIGMSDVSQSCSVPMTTILWGLRDSSETISKIPYIFYHYARYLKIIEKVSFNIASEASYLYILSGQKLIKNAKNGPFWRVFENLKLAVKQCYQTGQF